MALIDVSEVFGDPSFTENVTHIVRSSTVNEHGLNVLVDTSTTITAIVQPDAGQMLQRLPEAARLKDFITVYAQVNLTSESSGGYADIIIWQGKRWQVQIATSWMNWGVGYTQALCALEDPNNG